MNSVISQPDSYLTDNEELPSDTKMRLQEQQYSAKKFLLSNLEKEEENQNSPSTIDASGSINVRCVQGLACKFSADESMQRIRDPFKGISGMTGTCSGCGKPGHDLCLGGEERDVCNTCKLKDHG